MKTKVLYVTNPDWGQEREEMRLIPDRDDLQCVSCGTTENVYKMMCDTPSSFACPDGECEPCLRKTYPKVETLKNLKINTIKLQKQFDEEFIFETLQEDQKCERCDTTGAYTIDGDPADVGFCLKHIEKSYGKENVEVIEN